MDGDRAAQALCDAARADVVAARQAHHRLLERVAELEVAGVGTATGFRDTVRVVAQIWHLDSAEAHRLVDTASDLVPCVALSGEPLPARLPATGAASSAGRIGEHHIRIVRTTMRRIAAIEGMDAATETAAETLLADWACDLPPAALQKAAHRLLATLDPDGEAPIEDGGREDELNVGRRRDGSLALKGHIRDRADAETMLEVLDALSSPAGPDDRRSLGQRRAEALKDLVAQAVCPTGVATEVTPDETAPVVPAPRGHEHDDLSESTTARPPGRALLMITLDHRWLQRRVGHGVLDSETTISPDTARRWACDAAIVPAVLGSRSEPLDVGRLSYTVTEAQRRALHQRDGGCAFPGCTRRPRRCHAHHVKHWADGGATTLDNLTLLCRFHHTVVHHEAGRHGGWTVEMRHGRPWFTPPSWVDPDRRPRPGGRPLVPG